MMATQTNRFKDQSDNETHWEHFVSQPAGDITSRLVQYTKEKPEVAIAWSFLIGIAVGIKLKP